MPMHEDGDLSQTGNYPRVLPLEDGVSDLACRLLCGYAKPRRNPVARIRVIDHLIVHRADLRTDEAGDDMDDHHTAVQQFMPEGVCKAVKGKLAHGIGREPGLCDISVDASDDGEAS